MPEPKPLLGGERLGCRDALQGQLRFAAIDVKQLSALSCSGVVLAMEGLLYFSNCRVVRGSPAGQRLSVRHLCECREEDLGGFEASALAELVCEPSAGGANGAAAVFKERAMDLIGSLGVFARIAELGSFSAVARELRESHSAVTRQIGNLEEHFKARLFHRNTRGLTLTEDGRELLGYARQMLDLAETMESAVKRQREIPQGLVRLGVPTAISMFLVPRLPKLFERFPGLSIDLVIRDHTFDLVEERLDLALQIGRPIADTSLVARTMPRVARMVAVAAPSYLERRGAPQTPADLEQHDCILHSDLDSAGWLFAGPNGSYRIRVLSRLTINNSATVHLAALNGHGIARLPDLWVFDDIKAGRLRRLLAGHEAPGETEYILYPSRRHLAPRTRAVIEFLLERAKEADHQLRQ